ncbi:MAG: methyltransferase domain-containing protein [Elusimicrobiota bacterium]
MRSKDRKIDYSLKLCREVLGLPAFHFGYFERETRNGRGTDAEQNTLTIEDLKNAQLKYTEKLLDYIPSKVMTILDVGCGTGISTEILISKGYNVECLSPDLYNRQIINEKFKGAVKFHLTKFEEFSAEKKFDIILMSESSQYISLKKLFEKCKGILNKDGYLLISDYFRKEATGYYRNCAVLSRFLDEAEKNGFKIVRDEDITENVLPTLSIGEHYYRKFIIPITEALISLAYDEIPKTTKVIKFLFRRKIKKVAEDIRQKNPEKLNPEKFRQNLRYMIYLFQKTRE